MASGPGRGGVLRTAWKSSRDDERNIRRTYEIFEDQCYLRHGIRLQDGATVVDIGANIGLFSLFVMSRCKEPQDLRLRTGPGRARPFEGQLRCLRVECAGVERRRVGQTQNRDIYLL